MTGVSVSTVSRVLNNKSASCASKDVRDKIRAAAIEIGYRPNESARALQKGAFTSDTPVHVSIVLARIDSENADPFFDELLSELEGELFEKGMIIDYVVYATDSFHQDLSRSDGIIILGKCTGELLSHIKTMNNNIVGIWRNPMNFDIDEVVCDGEKAARVAMEYLFSLGHKKIAYIGSCTNESRYVGYVNSMIGERIPLIHEIIKQTNQTRNEGFSSVLSLLNIAGNKLKQSDNKKIKSSDVSAPAFSAILCANDITAIGVLSAISKLPKKIRETLSVISIDDITDAGDTKPYLSTVRIPKKEMAHMAIMLINDKIKNLHSENIRIELPPRLVIRDSCYVNVSK